MHMAQTPLSDFMVSNARYDCCIGEKIGGKAWYEEKNKIRKQRTKARAGGIQEWGDTPGSCLVYPGKQSVTSCLIPALTQNPGSP